MMDMEDFDGLVRDLIENFVRVPNERSDVDPGPLLDLFGAQRPTADTSQHGRESHFECRQYGRIICSQKRQDLIEVV